MSRSTNTLQKQPDEVKPKRRGMCEQTFTPYFQNQGLKPIQTLTAFIFETVLWGLSSALLSQEKKFPLHFQAHEELFCGSWNPHTFLVRVTRVQVKFETEDIMSSLRSSSKIRFIHLSEKVLKPPADSPHAGKCRKICTCQARLKF